MKRFTVSVMVTAVLGLAAYSLADAHGVRPGFDGRNSGIGNFQERGPGRGPGRGGGMFALRGLDLTADQTEQVKAIHDAERANRENARADADLHRQLRAALFADQPDAQKIAALQQQLIQAQSARLARQIAVEQKVASVLTAEQRAQLRERLEKNPRAAQQ